MTNPRDDFGAVRCECFILADGAQEAGGKLFVLGGGWDHLYSPQFPATHPQLCLAIKLVVPWSAMERPHELVIELVDEDGRSVLPQEMRLEFNVGRPQGGEPGDDISLPLCTAIAPFVVPAPARYTFFLRIDGQLVARTSFRASQTPNRPG